MSEKKHFSVVELLCTVILIGIIIVIGMAIYGSNPAVKDLNSSLNESRQLNDDLIDLRKRQAERNY